jgi:quinol monooxygenase YgiN
MQAKQGKDREVEEFLRSALPLVENEPDTTAWFAVRFGRGAYGIFDVFPDDAARDAHLAGPIAAALQQRVGELFDAAPRIQKLEVLADKLPVVSATPDTKGLLITFKAKAGHEREIEEFIRYAQDVVNDEHLTTAWFAVRMESGEYGIFDVFPDNDGRFLHLLGQAPRELAKHAFTLLSSVPDLQMVSVAAEKIGTQTHQVSQ